MGEKKNGPASKRTKPAFKSRFNSARSGGAKQRDWSRYRNAGRRLAEYEIAKTLWCLAHPGSQPSQFDAMVRRTVKRTGV